MHVLSRNMRRVVVEVPIPKDVTWPYGRVLKGVTTWTVSKETSAHVRI